MNTQSDATSPGGTKTAVGSFSVTVADTDEEREAIVELARPLFPRTYRASIRKTDHMLVAWGDGEIIGGLIMKTKETAGNQIGVISWIFTARHAREQGVATELLSEGLSYLDEYGCDVAVTDIEGFNSGSAALFASAGFTRTTSRELARQVSLRGLLHVWVTLSYQFDFGHFLWAKRLGETSSSEPVESTASDTAFSTTEQSIDSNGITAAVDGQQSLALSWMLNILVIWVAAAAVTAIPTFGLAIPELVALAVAGIVLFALRYLPLWALTRGDPLEWQYRGWFNGIPISIALGAVLGIFFPTTGDRYPASNEWRYAETLQRIGPAAAISAVLTLWIVVAAGQAPELFPTIVGASTAGAIQFVGFSFLVVDLLFVLTPFQCYRGRRIYDWNRPVWILLAGATAVVISLTMM